jgi:NADPH2:quinone reductase
MKAVRYDRFTGIDGIYLAELPEPVPGTGEVVLRVEAGALNPGALPALHGSSYTPGRDLAGEVVAVGADVNSFTVGDAVLGWLQSWDAHAQLVAIPAAQLASRPQGLPWDVAGSLYTTPMAGLVRQPPVLS